MATASNARSTTKGSGCNPPRFRLSSTGPKPLWARAPARKENNMAIPAYTLDIDTPQPYQVHVGTFLR